MRSPCHFQNRIQKSMTISPLDRRFLDLMDRIEQTQQDQIAALTQRLAAAEQHNAQLTTQLADLENLIQRQGAALSSLNDTLARFLAPPDTPPLSDALSDGSGI
jgi:septal ring factor EnvC (AmiA/AmiB activator)